MAKLYPPNINGTIPAFYYSEGTTNIVVPFTMNRAVAPSEIAGFALKIKTTTGEVKGVVTINAEDMVITTSSSVTFSISNIKFLVGQHYKLQLAYKDKSGVIGYYSSVGIAKCTTRPIVSIEGLQAGQSNAHVYSYTGVYSQKNKDVTEKMYSYRFILSDSEQNILIDSGEILHNTATDILPYESHEEFYINQDLEDMKYYYLQFIVTTVNKLVISSTRYKIIQRKLIPPEVSFDLMATMNYENGYTSLSIHNATESVITGTFLITRASSKNNYNWEELKRFDLESTPPDDWSFKDFTVEQGIIYKYSIQQYNAQGIYSERIISNVILADFEDMFLYDGEKQLKIRFNPGVSSFKSTILENKTDTIGSQFPFFSRNGRVNYKEFPISGLISYLMDEAEIFINVKDIGLDGFSNMKQRSRGLTESEPDESIYKKYKTTNLVDYNIAAERRFKNIVLDWLNDGQVKLFRSPAEGNYLVRLMNVSLSPTDSLSRMLHSFSCSAYEVGEFNLQSLNYFGLIDIVEKPAVIARWATIDLRTAVEAYLKDTGKTFAQALSGHDSIALNTRNAVDLEFVDMIPGTQVMIDDQIVQIGATGTYILPGKQTDPHPIGTIRYIIDSNPQGQLTYQYYTQVSGVFNSIDEIKFYDVPLEQFIGIHYEAKQWDSASGTFILTNNLLDAINDIRTNVSALILLRALKRPVETLYIRNNSDLSPDITINVPCYTDMYCTNVFDWSTANPLFIYNLRYEANTSPYNNVNGYQYYVDANLNEFSTFSDYYVDGFDKKVYTLTDNNIFSFTINDTDIDLTETQDFVLQNPSFDINNIVLQNGVYLEICYSKQVKTYAIESNATDYDILYKAKQRYENELNILVNARQTIHYDSTLLKTLYTDYLIQLNLGIERYRREHGLNE